MKPSKEDVLAALHEAASRHLSESAAGIEDLKALLPAAKGAQERTALNILIDDSKKVVKALERLKNDIEESLVG